MEDDVSAPAFRSILLSFRRKNLPLWQMMGIPHSVSSRKRRDGISTNVELNRLMFPLSPPSRCHSVGSLESTIAVFGGISTARLAEKSSLPAQSWTRGEQVERTRSMILIATPESRLSEEYTWRVCYVVQPLFHSSRTVAEPYAPSLRHSRATD